jgi:hypothetical protein
MVVLLALIFLVVAAILVARFVDEGGAADWLRHPSSVSVGPDADTRHLDNAPAGYVLRITKFRTLDSGFDVSRSK